MRNDRKSASWTFGIQTSGATAVVAFVAACGGSGGGDVACDTHMGTVHVCWAYGGATAETEAQGACQQEPGTLATACPTASRLGSCVVPSNGGVTTTLFFYSDGGETAMAAQIECANNGGAWTAGP
jgi:hypothetical protein